MKKLYVSLCVFVSGLVEAQTTVSGSFMHDNINRSYSFYVPASYNPAQPLPLVLGLHGTGSSGAQFAQYRDFRPIADTARFIMVHPDGSTLLGQKFWNFGNVLGSTVDDVGFLTALIDTISAHYAIDPSRVYSVGMSNGGFMTYYLACQTDRFAAIGSVTGSMSNAMYANCHPQRPTPSIHVHGTADPTNPYAGNSSSKSIREVTRFWVNQNGCDTVPAMFPVANTNTGDNATAERYLYANGINGHTVEHFKVIGGEHTWPGSPMPGSSDITCMDFDARIEIWRFFCQYRRNTLLSVKDNTAADEIILWPNPAREDLYIQAGNHTVTKVVITDLQGRIVEQLSGRDIRHLQLGGLEAGTYLANISGPGFQVVKKLIVY